MADPEEVPQPPASPPPPSGGALARRPEEPNRGLSTPATSEQMQEMNDRLASVQEMLKKLPGTIGAAVAQALTRPASHGPPVPLENPFGKNFEFQKGQGMKVDGKVVTEGRVPIPQKPKPHKK